MRKQLCEALLKQARNPNMVFLTGDLGFMALEPLREVMGNRFINTGVAEQNMVSVAAALAKQCFNVWAYSIAPFIYARPFEQIRNDVAFHGLPVKLIGNGGGYGYGVMGPTHHAIEDYGVVLALPNMKVYVPVFDEDVEQVVEDAGLSTSPCYLRMGRGEPPKNYDVPPYSPWRQLTNGDGPVVIGIGPLAGSYISAFQELPVQRRPKLWALSELPLEKNIVPSELLTQMATAKCVCVAEEHVSHGGVASDLLLYLASRRLPFADFRHFFAKAHHYKRYGSQQYLRQQSGLDAASVIACLERETHG